MYETVIYADVLFGINLVANLCVLLITDWIFKFSARISRMIISATLGAVWAVICVCIPLRFALLEKFITYVPVTLIMAMIMLSGTKDFKQKTSKQLKLYMRNLLKAGAGMILIALFAGGIMHWLKYTFAGYFIENVILSDSELVIFLTVTVIYFSAFFPVQQSRNTADLQFLCFHRNISCQMYSYFFRYSGWLRFFTFQLSLHCNCSYDNTLPVQTQTKRAVTPCYRYHSS